MMPSWNYTVLSIFRLLEITSNGKTREPGEQNMLSSMEFEIRSIN